MRTFYLLGLCMVLVLMGACGSTSSTDSGDGGGSGGTTTIVSYATFGETLSNVVASGLKTGGVNASISVKALTDDCATSYDSCPYITETNGGDSAAGEILMRLWAMDYTDSCTDELKAAGTCFTCEDCNSGSGTDYMKPTMFSDPDSCATSAVYTTNFGVDPCAFDSMIADIDNYSSCHNISGVDVDISGAIPWYSSWSIPQYVNFSGFQSGYSSDGGLWWTVNDGDSSDTQYFIRLDSDWLYGGVKDTANDQFIFFATGSPAYYVSASEDSGVNLSAYAGPISTTTQTFEAMQVRDQGSSQYVERMKANGTHLWYQQWRSDSFPATPDDLADSEGNPSDNRCLEIGEKIVTSKYVPLADCVTAFGKETVAELNAESNFILKLIDGESVGSIAFSTPLTSDTSSDCMESEGSEE